jgi:hypothetical protein
MRRMLLVCLFPVTVDDGIDVHVNASYFQAQGVRQLQLVSKFGFHSYDWRKSNFTDVRRWEREQYLQSFSRKSWTRLLNRQPELCQFSEVKIRFNDVSSDRLMSSSSAFVNIPVIISPWNGFAIQFFRWQFLFLQGSNNQNIMWFIFYTFLIFCVFYLPISYDF